MAGIKKGRQRAGTLGALIEQWKLSPDYCDLKESTRSRYGRLENHLQFMAAVPISTIKRRHILNLRDNHTKTPGTASGLVSLISTLMAFAMDRELIPHNPASRIKRPKMGRHGRWNDEDLALFLAKAPQPMQRAALLAVETGQRRGDLLALTWTAWKGGYITLRQQKTGQLVEIPATDRLAVALAEWRQEASSVTILESGRLKRPWTYGGFGASWEASLRFFEMAGRVTFHGLRATFCCVHAENGASPHEIMAMTGHQTLAQVERYTRDVDRKRNASAAITRLDDVRRIAQK
jgi:integrase